MYKLDANNNVTKDGTTLPVRFVNGVAELLDEHSPFVKDFVAWNEAGNSPAVADPAPVTVAVATLDDVIAVVRSDPALSTKLDAQIAERAADNMSVKQK